MKTKLLIIIFILFTTKAFAWSNEDYDTFYGGCFSNVSSEYSYSQKKTYCTCATDLVSYVYTVYEVEQMVLNKTFIKQKKVENIVKKCSKHLIK